MSVRGTAAVARAGRIRSRVVTSPAPVPAAARDTWRDQVAQLLLNTSLRSSHQPNSGAMALEQADALLPVLVAAQREAAAKAVERAADWLAGTGQDGSLPGGCAPDETTDGLSWIQDVGDRDSALDWCQMSLRDRASALRAGGETT